MAEGDSGLDDEGGRPAAAAGLSASSGDSGLKNSRGSVPRRLTLKYEAGDHSLETVMEVDPIPDGRRMAEIGGNTALMVLIEKVEEVEEG